MSIAFYLALTIVARAVSLLSVLLFARTMNPSDFGVYGFLQTSASVIVTFTTFNLPTPIAVVLARGGGHRLQLENTILAAVLLASMALAAGVSLLSLHFAFPAMSIGSDGGGWFVVFAGMTSLQLMSGAALVARGERIKSAVGILLGALILCGAAASVRSLSLTEALRVGGLSAALGGMASACMLLSGGLHNDLRHASNSLFNFVKRNGSGIFLFSIVSFGASLSFQLGLWFLQRQLLARGGAVEAAIFTLGNQFYNVVLFLPGVLGPLLLRRLSIVRLESDQVRETSRVGAASFGVASLGLAIFVAIAPLILLVLPEKYRIGVEPPTLAVAAGALMFAKAPFSVFFQARVSASAELAASLVAATVLVGAAFVPAVITSAIGSLWLRAVAHFVLLGVVFVAFVVRWRKVATNQLDLQ